MTSANGDTYKNTKRLYPPARVTAAYLAGDLPVEDWQCLTAHLPIGKVTYDDMFHAILARAAKFDFDSVANHLLLPVAKAIFYAATARVLADFDAAIARARADFDAAMAKPRADYDAAIARARADFYAAIARARADYEAAMAKAFVNTYFASEEPL